MKELYFIRHGQTEYNKLRIIQGSGVNSDLNETGIAQGQAFFNRYKNIGFEVVLSSALKRTHQTVKPFVDTGIPWEQWEAINEMNWGVHEGKVGTPEMGANYKKMVEEWGKGNFDHSLEGAESARQLADRVTKFVNHLPNRTEQKILICSHGRTMRCLMSVLQGEHLREMEKYMHHNTGLYKVIWDGNRFNIEIKNDISHLG